MSTTLTCDHEAIRCGGLDVVACAVCGLVEYHAAQAPVAPGVALAQLFGDYDLVGTLPALHAPGREVMLYRAPSRVQRRHLAAFPVQVWFQVDAGLWLAHDGALLLLATAAPVHTQLTGA